MKTLLRIVKVSGKNSAGRHKALYRMPGPMKKVDPERDPPLNTFRQPYALQFIHR